VEIVEALSALLLRLGQPRDAERQLNAAVASEPKRARLHMLLAQCLRAQGHLDAALATAIAGQAEAGLDVGLSTERGAILAARGDLEGAKVAWREALSRDPVHPAPFTALGALALKTKDAQTAQLLVDAALGSPHTQPDVLRRSVHLALATEAEGLPRASRVARLCTRLLENAPNDHWASLALARSQVVLGDVVSGRARLLEIERAAPSSSAAAEAQAVRVVLDDPQLEAQLLGLQKAAQTGPEDGLAEVAARARRMATLHALWPAWVAAAMADRRRGALAAARSSLQAALDIAPGASVAHVELAEVLLELGDAAGAELHARRATEVEGETPRALEILTKAQQAQGRTDDARRPSWIARFSSWRPWRPGG
jgi:predicted Zn-dependent protease